MTEDELSANLEEYLSSARLLESHGKLNAAIVMYYKTMCSLADTLIFKKIGRFPTNHTERFQILKGGWPEVYRILDKNFPLYKETYFSSLGKEALEVIKNDFEKIVRIAET